MRFSLPADAISQVTHVVAGLFSPNVASPAITASTEVSATSGTLSSCSDVSNFADGQLVRGGKRMTTMIADPPPKATRLGVGFDANRRAPQNREAWKQAIGTKPISARLAMLPEPKRNWNRIGVSAGVQIALFIFLLMVPLFYPEKMATALNYRITEIATPVIEIPVAPPPPAPKIVKVKAPPVPDPVVEPPKLNPKQVHIFMQPKAVIQPKAQPVEVRCLTLQRSTSKRTTPSVRKKT